MSLVLFPRQSLVDVNGIPRVGARCYVYDAGTTTPRVTYPTAADAEAETNPQTQPIESVTGGTFPPIYVKTEGGPIKITLTDSADVPITGYPVDNIAVEPSLTSENIATSLNSLKRTAAEIAAEVTPTDYAYAPGDVRRYGADPTGVASSRDAFVNAALAHGRPYAPTGTYLIDQSVTVPSNRVFYGDGPATVIKMTGNNLRAFRVNNATNVEIHSMAFNGQKPSVGWETTNNFDFAIRVGETTTVSQNEGIYIHDIWLKDIGLDGIYVTNTRNCRIRDIHSDNCRRWAVVVGHQSTDTFYTGHVSVKDVFAVCTNGSGPSGKEFPLGAVDCEPDGASSFCDFVELDGVHSIGGSVVMSNNAIRYSSVRNVFIEDSRLVLSNGIKIAGPVILKGKSKLEVDGLADSVQTQAYLTNVYFFDPQYANGSSRQFVSSENLWPTDVMNADATNTASGISGAAIVRSREAVEVDGFSMLADKLTYPDGTTGTYLVKHQITANLVIGDQVCAFLEIYRTDSNAPTGNYLYVEIGSVIRTLQVPIGLSRIVIADALTANVTNPTINVGFTGTPGQAPSVIFRKVFFYVNPTVLDDRMFRVQEALYAPGSFTGTLTGCTTSPTGTIEYSRSGDVVVLRIPAITGTSNTTAATVTGIPAHLRPATTQVCIGVCTDNGASSISKIEVTSGGVLTLHTGISATFTNSGTKGCQASSITYRLR